MIEEAKKELEILERRQEETIEKLEEARAKFIKLIDNAESYVLANMQDYTEYNKIIKYARELEELKIKIRTIVYVGRNDL